LFDIFVSCPGFPTPTKNQLPVLQGRVLHCNPCLRFFCSFEFPFGGEYGGVQNRTTFSQTGFQMFPAAARFFFFFSLTPLPPFNFSGKWLNFLTISSSSKPVALTPRAPLIAANHPRCPSRLDSPSRAGAYGPTVPVRPFFFFPVLIPVSAGRHSFPMSTHCVRVPGLRSASFPPPDFPPPSARRPEAVPFSVRRWVFISSS